MTGYKLSDRLKEVSSYMGFVLVALATWISYHASPGDPMALVSPLLQAFGSFGIAMPEKGTSATIEQLTALVVKALETAKEQAPKTAAMLVLAIVGSLGLEACSAPPSSSSAPIATAPAINVPQVLWYLQAAGCLGEVVAGAAAPIVTIAADAKGGQVLNALGSSGATLCATPVTVPPSALPAPLPAGTPAVVLPVAAPKPSATG